MQRLNLCNKSVGRIWHRKLNPEVGTGCFLDINHCLPSTISANGREIRFLQSCFDIAGNAFVACDHQGNLFHFDLQRNRFSLIHKIGLPCTAIAFNLHHPNEVLVACSDYSLHCYNTESKELVRVMKGHSSAIHHISVHGSGRFAITCSQDTSILWDLDTFTKKRTLNGAEEVGVQQVSFLPSSNTIVSCFKDDSIFAWDCDSLRCLYQLNHPPGVVPGFRCLASNRDSNLLIGAGRSQFLYVWNLDSKNLLHIIELPPKMKDIKQITFINDTVGENISQQTCIALPSDGILRVIDIETCKLLIEIGHREQRVAKFTVSPKGDYIIGIMENGHINVYSYLSLIKHGKKVQGPLVQKIAAGQGKRSADSHPKLDPITSIPYLHWQKENKESPYRDLPHGLNMSRLLKILKGFGEYPSKYRMFIWRSILRLPENHIAFSTLLEKGTHSTYLTLHEKYPIKSQRLLRALQRVLSALAHWAPIFGETDFLPVLAFPIVKMFSNNLLVAFEIIATILVNWGNLWFEFFPNPPLTCLGMIETLLGYHDKRLLAHFVQFDVTSQLYSWPLMQTLFSEIFTKDEWFRVWDNMFSNHPAFMSFVIVSYLCNARQALFTAKEKEEFKSFFHHRNSVCVKTVVKDAYRLMEATPEDINPCRMMEAFVPLTKGQYPIFEKYPKFVVDYLVQEREKIREEELEYLRQKHVALDLKKESDKRRNDEEAFFRQQQMMLEAEKQRRQLVKVEEQKLSDQRIRLQALRREIALKELNLLDGTRRKFLKHQSQMKSMELQRLEDDLQRKALCREQETRAAVDDAEIKALELEAQKRLFQQEMMQDEAKAEYLLKTTSNLHEKKAEVNDMERMHLLESAHLVDYDRLRKEQSALSRLDHENQTLTVKGELDLQYQIDDIDRKMNNLQVIRHALDNQRREEELHGIVNDTLSLKRDISRNTTQARKAGREMVMETDHSDHENEDGGMEEDEALKRKHRIFEQRQLDLMTEIRELRRKFARKRSLVDHLVEKK